MAFMMRKAVPGEEGPIVSIIIRTWKAAYRGIIDADYLDALEENNSVKLERIKNNIIDNGVYVAISENQIVGVATFGPSRNEKYSGYGEIVELYILPEFEYMGIGRTLVTAVRAELGAQGYKAMLIDCLSENSACTFYKKMGGRLAESGEISIGGRAYPLSYFVFDL